MLSRGPKGSSQLLVTVLDISKGVHELPPDAPNKVLIDRLAGGDVLLQIALQRTELTVLHVDTGHRVTWIVIKGCVYVLDNILMFQRSQGCYFGFGFTLHDGF